MNFTAYQIFLVVAYVATGSTSTLLSKWVSTSSSVNSIGDYVKFRHPFLQTNGMFLGELICLLIYYGFKWTSNFYNKRKLQRSRKNSEPEGVQEAEPGSDAKLTKPFTWKKAWIFILPALCDMIATSLMYVGLALTTASSYQMLRGAVIVFTGIASRVLLRKYLIWYQWVGMLVIILGLVIVGSGDMLSPSDSNEDTSLLGDVIIIAAQIVVALQLTFEEKVLKKYDIPPLEAVGWEGFFGFTILTVVMAVFSHVKTNSKVWGHSPIPPYYVEDALDGLTQLKNNEVMLAAFLSIILLICLSAFLGITLTKERSATTRTITDSGRTLVVWVFSLAFKWQDFHYLQPIGFITLVLGIFLYYNFLIVPLVKKYVIKSQPKDNGSSAGRREEGISSQV